MDEQQRRIVEDLTGTIRGDVSCDSITVAMYASDASLYQITPLGVVCPRDSDDVVTLARYSSETNLPLIARGAGTGICGQAIGKGLIVDFSRYMRRIISIDDQTVRVEPGVVLDQLNRQLRSSGRYFSPDPSNAAVTTIGSMLAMDAAGSRSVRVGSTRDHVASIEVVLAGGHRMEVGDESLDQLRVPAPAPSGSLFETLGGDHGSDEIAIKRNIVSKLAKLLADNEELIRQKQPANVRNTCGYFLRGVLGSKTLHLPRLLVGSEGTLALVTATTLHTTPLPEYRAVALLLFGSLDEALSAVQAVSPQQPSACDLLDRRLLSLGREADSRFGELIPTSAEAALLVEQTGFSTAQANERIQMAVSAVRATCGTEFISRVATTTDEVEFLWSLPRKVVPMLSRLTGKARPIPIVEDIAVPPTALRDFLLRAQKVLQKYEVIASLYAHAAAGQVHLRPFLSTPTSHDAIRLEELARELYQIVFSVQGSISGEHGDGLSRTAFIRSQYGPLYRVFQQVKDLFDPHNLLNPGKIIADDPHITVKNLRPAEESACQIIDLQLRWNPSEMREAAMLCNGCGNCKTREDPLRMCPFFRADASESAGPRSKANVMRAFSEGVLQSQEMSSSGIKELTKYCFNCKQCQLECPSNVNIPQLVTEAKATYVAANGLSSADWILSRAHSFGQFGCRFSFASNWALQSPLARWIIDRFVGIHRQRKLPQFARKSFLQSWRRQLRTQAPIGDDDRTVVYFVDHYANYHDPELAFAFVRVLEHLGYRVIVPEEQIASGMAMISAGDLVAARAVAERNVRELAEFAREGVPIVCTEPAAALCLRNEYPMIFDHPDVGLVAEQTIEAGQFFSNLKEAGELDTNFVPLELEAAYHTPCHIKALTDQIPFHDLLSLIPGLKLRRIEEGCSGMAGAFGLTRENFRTSIRIGRGLISQMRSGEVRLGTTECSSCKIQMEQGTPAPTIHPVKLLALAYGLMPELRRKLDPNTNRFVVS